MSNKSRMICVALLATSVIPVSSNAMTALCGMTQKYTHGSTGVKIFSSSQGVPSIFYHSKMNVNTDGAARSYHPDDPNGSRIAYNNMANAITEAWSASGRKITCDNGKAKNRKGSCYVEFIRSFEGARDINYNPNRFPKFKTTNIIPWEVDTSVGWSVPCQNKSKENAGFFVSQTSLRLKGGNSCDQGVYVDSLSINAVVYPGYTSWYAQGVLTDKGDLVVTRNRDTGAFAFAINGDAGPSEKVGEGTIALASLLSGKEVLPTDTYKDVKKLALESVDYLVFPANDIVKHFGREHDITQEDINVYGEEVFGAWGGVARLDACVK